ncbi:hypothetical protein POM88_041287 [Heracleum sosnowskyi]|uniref:RNase H type-1 domain-containing protein n=1 Tax=Heracleum sosnowskyi TaxID=360622 RepID=A0AAD8HFX0_9APIA|nr:hypothetical protein POM88_041287 [Heracleum sosnowskyi]
MEHFWTLPPLGVVKVNVHGATPFIPFQNGNVNDLGFIIRNSEGELLKLSTRVFPANSTLENKLNAIHQSLIKAFEGNYKEVIVETDNIDAFKVLKNFPHGVPREVEDVTKPIGAVEKLLSLDLGFRHTAPQFQDIEIHSDEEDPVDFGHPQLPNEGIIHGGYAFHEDYRAVVDEGLMAPLALPVHEVEFEDFIMSEGWLV